MNANPRTTQGSPSLFDFLAADKGWALLGYDARAALAGEGGDRG